MAPELLADDREELQPGDRSILIIEDDLPFARIIMHQAQKSGFKCLIACDGNSGLHLAKAHEPTAIILDLGLPDIDGITVLDGLKLDLTTRHIPVHVVSARDKTPHIMQKGAASYLTKPIDTADIDNALSAIDGHVENSLKKVLLVEDDGNIRKAVSTLVASESVQITGAGSGNQAHQRIVEQNFDCIILDLGLPDMSGFELLEQLEKDPAVNLPPIIVYTGKDLTPNEVHKLDHYAAKVVIKGADSPERLLDEASLFLHTVAHSLPQQQKQLLRMLHDPTHLLKDRKVLLVDDDLRNSFALSRILEKAELSVVMAENGKVALETLDKDSEIELVLMDIMMPIMDGYETIAKIREQPRFSDLPIVALTAKAMAEDRAKCIEAGANDYLAKPVDVEKLMSLLRVLLFR